jgi:hypothetical protein
MLWVFGCDASFSSSFHRVFSFVARRRLGGRACREAAGLSHCDGKFAMNRSCEIINRIGQKKGLVAQRIRGPMQAQLQEHLPLSESLPSESDGNDGQSHLHQVLQCSVLPDAVNLGRPKDSAHAPISPDQLRQFAQKLPTNTHVTSLNLSYQSIGPGAMLELVGPLALLTSLQELHLAGAYAPAHVFMTVWQHVIRFVLNSAALFHGLSSLCQEARVAFTRVHTRIPYLCRQRNNQNI